MIFFDLPARKIWYLLYVHLNAQCHHLPPLLSPKALTTNDLGDVTAYNAAPSLIFAITNSTATPLIITPLILCNSQLRTH